MIQWQLTDYQAEDWYNCFDKCDNFVVKVLAVHSFSLQSDFPAVFHLAP